MSRKLMAALLSSTLVLGSVSTSAWSAPDAANQTQSDQTKNQAPLAPAGAAGIKQAQGVFGEYPLLTLALIGGAIALVWILLDDDDDDEEVPSTGTS